jgi:hypothetical protein
MCRNNFYLPAVPPSDYKGTLAKWKRQLKKLGKMKASSTPLIRVWLTEKEYIQVLEKCEA